MKSHPHRLLVAVSLALGISFSASAKTPDGKPFILFVAGKQSHGPAQHEHNAGVQLLAKCINQGEPQVVTKFHLNAEWPSAEELAQADTIVLYSDGGGGHVALQGDRLTDLKKEMDRGCGLVCLHYAVEPAYEKSGWPEPQIGPDGKPLPQPIPPGRGSKGKGAAEFLDWLGGYFEQYWSVNPHWQADFKELPKHPITNGVHPFSTNDEWYFHMRFRPGMQGVTPILSAIAPPETMNRGEGTHSGNPDVKREVLEEKKPQIVSWASERANGGRGFGFSGGHFHEGWGNDDQRKLVLNAIVWTAKLDVPANGVASTVTPEDLTVNLDPKGQPKPAAPAPAPAPAKSGASNSTVKPLYSSPVVHDKAVEIKADLKGAKELYLAVTDGGDGFTADWAVWLNPVLVKADGSKIKLTDLKPKSAQTGWGEFGVNLNPAGKPIKVGGHEMPNGFGAHAPSLAAFDLPEGVVAVEAEGAIDDGGTRQGGGATVKFQLFAQNPGPAAIALSAPAASAGPTERFGWDNALKNMSTFKAADGLQAGLFAAEPMITNPTNIQIDPRGRVWATECENYRKYMEQRPEGDRVVILEDTKGNGVADKEKTFFQSKELTNPLGICVLPQAKGTKVIVSAAPNVWLLTDKDGDDVAEDAKIIFKVGGVWNYDHQVHAFCFGPDGKFYFNAGNSITELNYPDGTRVKDLAGNEITNKGEPYRQGMVFRCDIDLETGKATNVETLGHNFRNNYKVALDSFGSIWQSDNDDDGNKGVRINYVMQFGNYGYTDEKTGAGWRTPRTNIEKEIPLMHWHQNDPGVVPNLLQTGAGSPTGMVVNEGTALGPQFTNQVIHCDAGPRTVRAYPVENDGAGYKATMVDILTSTDSWYRVSDVDIAPDGSLFIADWYDPGVGGHAMGDNVIGKMMGRIYRVAAQAGSYKITPPDFSTAENCVKALTSPNRATQYVAWRTLHDMQDKAEPALSGLWKSENPRLRARALGLLTQIKGREIEFLTAGFKDRDPNVRIAAIRLARTVATTRDVPMKAIEEDRTLLANLVQDTNPQVRREIAVCMHGAKHMEQLWAALAQQHDGKDRWYLEALGIGAAGNEDACFDAWLTAVGDKWNTPAGRDILWRLRTAKTAQYLTKILSDKSVAETDKPRYLRAFDFLPEAPEKTKSLVQLAGLGTDMNSVAVEALSRLKGVDMSANPEVKAALDKQLAINKGTTRFIEIVRDFHIKGQDDAMLDVALDHLSDPLANEALKLVLSAGEATPIFDAVLAGPKAEKLVTLLGTSSEPRIISRLTQIATKANGSLPSRKAGIQALARSQTGAQAIIQLAKNNQLAEDLKSTATTALNLVQYPSLKADIATYFPAPAALGGQALPSIPELIKIKGDAAHGKVVAERAESSCMTCHRIGDKGVDFAPALSEIGSKLPKEAIFDAIINPNAGISMGFETTQLQTKDGTVAIGIVRSETNDDLVLALPGGATNKFAKREIAKREKLTTSMMPSGLNQALTQQDLIDLVEYLVTLKKP